MVQTVQEGGQIKFKLLDTIRGASLLGSVSHAVLQHADRPVVVVPGAQVARKRSERRRERESDLSG